MSFAAVGAKIKAAQVDTFRSRYQIGPNQPVGLPDEEIAMIFHVSGPDKGGTRIIDKRREGEGERLKKMTPTALHAHYDKLRADRRFDRFVLFAKSHGNGTTDDAMIVAFGIDEIYYVAAVWDENGHDTWEPVPGDVGTPLVNYE